MGALIALELFRSIPGTPRPETVIVNLLSLNIAFKWGAHTVPLVGAPTACWTPVLS